MIHEIRFGFMAIGPATECQPCFSTQSKQTTIDPSVVGWRVSPLHTGPIKVQPKEKANEVNTATESVTAGPWHVEKFGGRYEVWRKDDGTTHTYVAVAQRQVDARLIAAAPDLLEACELVQRAQCGDGVDMSTAVDACLLAIAKAEDSL